MVVLVLEERGKTIQGIREAAEVEEDEEEEGKGEAVGGDGMEEKKNGEEEKDEKVELADKKGRAGNVG